MDNWREWVCGTFALLLALTGCGRSPVGIYVNQNNDHHFIEVKQDGIYFLQDYGYSLSGTYRVEGHTLILETSGGISTRDSIDGNTLTDPEGQKWVKK